MHPPGNVDKWNELFNMFTTLRLNQDISPALADYAQEKLGFLRQACEDADTAEAAKHAAADEKTAASGVVFKSCSVPLGAAAPEGEYKYRTVSGLEAKLLPGEPWFAFRGKDCFTDQVLTFYAELCRDKGLAAHADGVVKARNQIVDWQNNNRIYVKYPG